LNTAQAAAGSETGGRDASSAKAKCVGASHVVGSAIIRGEADRGIAIQAVTAIGTDVEACPARGGRWGNGEETAGDAGERAGTAMSAPKAGVTMIAAISAE